MDNTFLVVVQNRLKEGYRRAGFSFHLGENTLTTVSASQLAQLKADSRLVVQVTQQTSSAEGGKGVSKELEGGGEPKSLHTDTPTADLTVLTAEQLKAKLTELGIAFKQSATKAELIALLTPTGEKQGDEA